MEFIRCRSGVGEARGVLAESESSVILPKVSLRFPTSASCDDGVVGSSNGKTSCVESASVAIKVTLTYNVPIVQSDVSGLFQYEGARLRSWWMMNWVGTPTNGGGGKGLGVYEEGISVGMRATVESSRASRGLRLPRRRGLNMPTMMHGL